MKKVNYVLQNTNYIFIVSKNNTEVINTNEITSIEIKKIINIKQIIYFVIYTILQLFLMLFFYDIITSLILVIFFIVQIQIFISEIYSNRLRVTLLLKKRELIFYVKEKSSFDFYILKDYINNR